MGFRVSQLMHHLSLEEKVTLLSGATAWRTHGHHEIGLAPMLLSDGPAGVRGENFDHGIGVTVPCGTSLAASWNPDLVEEIGSLLGQEARRKSVHVLLAPTVNLIRSAFAGRNFECYSEDPWLTGHVAAAYIRGVQSQGVAATVKHFVGNEAETRRERVSSVIDERALREVYLYPFEEAVKSGDVRCVMAAYNRINGVYACESEELLDRILRDEWGFDGVVMSDWFALHDTVPAGNVSLDLEMPGPASHWGDKLLEAVHSGLVSEKHIEAKVRRLLELADWVGAVEGPSVVEPPQEEPEAIPLLRRAAAEGMVLLRNEGQLLPLPFEQLSSLAVIGPFAHSVTQGGGSASLKPLHPVAPLAGLSAALAPGAQMLYARGCYAYRGLPGVPPPGTSFTLEYFDSPEFEGEPTHTEIRDNGRFTWFADRHLIGEGGAVRVSYSFVPTDGGEHLFSIAGVGRQELYVNGERVLESDNPSNGQLVDVDISESRASVPLHAGQVAHVEARYFPESESFCLLSLGYLPPVDLDRLMEEAVEVAASAETAVVFVGTGGEWETEGRDRVDLNLPGRQDELVERVLEANSNTVVVVNAGAQVLMPWAERAKALIYAWFPGEEFGPAIADVLSGAVEPGGRLPITLPRSEELVPSPVPDDEDVLRYSESVLVGYRAYEKDGTRPLFCFGHGLGYTEFAYESCTLDGPDANGTVTATVRLRNVGARTGGEVVQLYVTSPLDGPDHPGRQLRAARKVWLGPGEATDVVLALPARAFFHWNTETHSWNMAQGRYGFEVGRSIGDLRLHVVSELPSLAQWPQAS